MVLTELFSEFFKSERSGGIILVCFTALSLVLTNVFYDSYAQIWNYAIGGHTLVQLINDGLMTIFFLLIGLELEREIYIGELSDLKSALLPVFAAMGGMLVPAATYLIFNWEGEHRQGAGIPMATDIAFALGVLSMLGKRVPASLKIFLTALAVMDDLGAILVIAILYTDVIHLEALGIALSTFGVLLILNRLKVYNFLPYLAGGVCMWYFMLHSGIHPTITGVLLAFAIPFGRGDKKSPSYILQSGLHVPVAFVILPLFALANTSIFINGDAMQGLGSTISLGIMAGLLIGKPVGIMLFSYLTTVFGISSLPEDLRWVHILGAGMLAGIGFTMSIFITLLAFQDSNFVSISKLSVLMASLLAGIAGFLMLTKTLPENNLAAT